MRRIESRRSRIGHRDASDPDTIRDLEERLDKHDRLTRGKPKESFRTVLARRQASDPDEPPEPDSESAPKEAHLGYAPGQLDRLKPTPSGRRSAKVIFRG